MLDGRLDFVSKPLQDELPTTGMLAVEASSHSQMLLKRYFTPFSVILLVYCASGLLYCGSEGPLCTMIQVLNPPPCRPVRWYKFEYFAAVLCILFSDQTECFEYTAASSCIS
jgi:hypothetical protein